MNLAHRRKSRTALFMYLSALCYVTLLLILARLGFFIGINGHLTPLDGTDILKALYIGFRFDARLAAIFTLPLAFILTIRPLGRKLRAHKNLFFVFYAVLFFILWTVYCFDTGFFAYLGERLNATIIELAADTADGFRMVSESYPLTALIVAVAVFSILCALPMRRIAANEVKKTFGRAPSILAWLCGFVIFAVAAYGQISSNLFPLRWSNAYFSTNTYVTALALNPVQNLYDTYRATQDDGFNLAQTRAVYPLMAGLLQVDAPDEEKLNYLRHSNAVPHSGNRPNIVIIIMESLSYTKTSFAPGNDSPTPHLKALADESVLFRNFFSNARTTARGVFSTMTGVPDVTESSTGSRNQRVIDQRVVANEFDGYDKYYLLGGNTAWANIRGIIANNIKDVHILEESYWKAPNVDVWGISDYDLLMEAHELFTTLRERPFLAVIQTASFHKPYTIPDNTPGFAYKPLSEETADNYGFIDEHEYNSMRYMDFSIGEFIKKAKASGYYDNTVFLIFGDHGVNDPSTNVTAAYNASYLRGWHVPLIVHAPARLASGVREDAASQVDVFPTAAGIAGIEYNNWTMGRDLFSKTQNQQRGAFISGKNDSPIRYVLDGYCYYDNRAGVQALYRLAGQEAVDLKTDEPEKFMLMKDRANAMQATAKYMLYNNKKF